MANLIEKIINLLSLWHYYRIKKILRPKNIKYLIDVGAHKGEFIDHFADFNFESIFAYEPQKKYLIF